MLEFLVSLVNSVHSTVNYTFSLVYTTGAVLVNSVKFSLPYLGALIKKLGCFAVDLSDSIIIFIQDNQQNINEIIHWSMHSITVIGKSINSFLYQIFALTIGTIKIIISICNSVIFSINCLIKFIIFLKQLLILFGSGVWLLITIIPIVVYNTFESFVEFIKLSSEFFLKISSSALKELIILITNFMNNLMDVPFGSVIGLLITSVFIYLFYHCYNRISSFLLRKLRMWYSQHQEAAKMKKTLRKKRTENGRPNNAIIDEEEIITCIICKEELKCILLLPCKHLCLCADCSEKKRLFDYKCPICRTVIIDTMKIYF